MFTCVLFLRFFASPSVPPPLSYCASTACHRPIVPLRHRAGEPRLRHAPGRVPLPPRCDRCTAGGGHPPVRWPGRPRPRGRGRQPQRGPTTGASAQPSHGVCPTADPSSQPNHSGTKEKYPRPARNNRATQEHGRDQKGTGDTGESLPNDKMH